MDVGKITQEIIVFTESCRIEGTYYQFASTPGGEETLYGSCFAVMLYHYLGHLDTFSAAQKKEWADYLNSWQDPETGYFIGPELVDVELQSGKHSYEHVSQHLAVHVLPALSLLGDYRARYPLTFAYDFLDPEYFQGWLDARDWRDAWLEGNNLLFAGQFLVYLRDVEKIPEAEPALTLYFSWLNREVDPATGLWGTNGYCQVPPAVYGGYHQLLLYYYENHKVNNPQGLVDAALSLQHEDGGFDPWGGGGACKDVDSVDILVNMYKQDGYKRPQIRLALRKALDHMMLRHMPDGGFVYYLDKPFMHMGIPKTTSPANQSNLFPTWFRVHTLALISQILTDDPIASFDWRFNNSLSMGWHNTWNRQDHALGWPDRQAETGTVLRRKARGRLGDWRGKVQRTGSKVKNSIR